MSQYLRTLNVQQDGQMDEQFMTDEELAKDLAMFTNTQFFDFDSGQKTDFRAPGERPRPPRSSRPPRPMLPRPTPSWEDFSGLDFMSG